MNSPSKKLLKIVIICILAATAIISVGQLVIKSYTNNHFDNERWGLDLYQFWYGGKFLLQGKNPYIELYQRRPLEYSKDVGNYPQASQNQAKEKRWKVHIVPASAPVFLLMAPLSLLPWVSATLAWLLVNMVLGVFFVWIILKCIEKKLLSLDGLLLLSLFFSLISTRQVFELGQTSLIVATFMWLSFLVLPHSALLSGVLLGIAFSKFTLALPMIFYFACRRKIKVLLYCFLTQALGLMILCIITQTNPITTLEAYLNSSKITLKQTQSFAVHLSAIPWGNLSTLLGWVITATTSVVPWWCLFRREFKNSYGLSALTLISIFSFWSLLVLYHGRQDMVITLPFIAMILFRINGQAVSNFDTFSVSKIEHLIINGICGLIFFVWIFPIYIITGLDFYRSLYTICTIVAFATSLRLLFSIHKQTS
jgi:hypothetical protein